MINGKKLETNPIIEIMKQSGLWKLSYILFILFWVTNGIVDVASNYFMGGLIDVAGKDNDYFFKLFLILLTCTFYAYIFSVSNYYLTSLVIEKKMEKLRNVIGEKFIKTPFATIENIERGEMLSRIMRDFEYIQTFFQRYLSNYIIVVIRGVLGLILSLMLSWKLTLSLLLMIPILILINVITSRPVEKLMVHQKEELGKSSGLAMNILSQITSVKAFSLETILTNRYIKQLRKIEQVENRIASKRALFTFVASISGILPYVVMMGVGSFLVMNNELSIGGFAIILFVVNYIVGFLGSIQTMLYQYNECKISSKRIIDILNLEEEVYLEQLDMNIDNSLNSIIELSNVNFSYLVGEDKIMLPVLNGINLDIKKGEKIAIVGASGSGKSTLFKLISGLYTKYEGSILIDGMISTSETINMIREKISIVTQENYLFPISIKDNIKCGKKDSTMDDVIGASKDANIHDFILSLPEGYDTILGENGCSLSGGQRQRICIARAYISKPQILLLDEPTASLDTETERLISKSLEDLMVGKTTIIIAHRLSTIQDCTRIYCMDNGSIVEVGNHEELYGRKGMYYNLYRKQKELESEAEVCA